MERLQSDFKNLKAPKDLKDLRDLKVLSPRGYLLVSANLKP